MDSLTLGVLKSSDLKKPSAVCVKTSKQKITVKLLITLENAHLTENNLLN